MHEESGDGACSIIKHHVNGVRPIELLGRILTERVERRIVVKQVVYNQQQAHEPGRANKVYDDLWTKFQS